MSSTGVRYPGTVATANTGADDDDWVNPSNVGADDGTEAQITAATFDTNDTSFALRCSNFGFDTLIPDDATSIDGITVEIDRRCFAGAASDADVQLFTSPGTGVGDDKASASAWPGTLTVATYGGVADTWNASLTVAQVRSSNFGVQLRVNADADNTDIGVDFVRITITYTDGTGAVRFVSSSSQSAANTSISGSFDYNAAYTFMAWVRFQTVTGDPTPFSVSADGSNYDQLYVNGVFRFQVNVGGSALTSVGTTTIAANTWYIVAVVREDVDTHRLYVGTTAANLAQEDTDTKDTTARTAANRLDIASFRASSNRFNGRMNAAKVWERVLSLSELQAEAEYWEPLSTTNQFASWRLDDPTTGLDDETGNGWDLTAVNGPLTEETGLTLDEVPSGTTYNQNNSGAITPDGALVKRTTKVTAGAISPAGALVKQLSRALSGAISPAGALVKMAVKPFGGTISPTGDLTGQKLVEKVVSGAVTPAGALLSTALKVLAGAVSPAGTLIKVTSRAVAGAITPAGVLTGVKVAVKLVDGTVTSAGTLVVTAVKGLAGAISPAGEIARTVGKVPAGAITPTAVLTTARTFLNSLTGAITPATGPVDTTHIPGAPASPPGGVLTRASRITDDSDYA